MGGIYGFKSTECIADPAMRLRSMRQALPVVTDTWCWEGPKGGQRVALGVLQSTWKGARGHFARRETGSVGVFDGVLFEKGSNTPVADGAGRLLDAYLQEGGGCFTRFNGSFNIAIWEPGPHRLILANDRIGQRPLYYANTGPKLAFGSYPAHVMAADFVRPEMTVGGLLDLIHYGFVTDDATIFKDVRMLPPGSMLVYEQGRISIDSHWRCDEVEAYGRLDRERIAELAEVLKRAMTRFVGASPATGLGLTGGIDSRALLAAAVSSGLTFVTHSGGQEQSTDVVVARALAAQCRIPHVFEPVGPELVSEWLYPMVRYQGGGVATLYSHPCQTFDYPLPFNGMVQGIGGTLLPLNASVLRVRISKAYRRLTSRAANLTGWPIHRANVPTTEYPLWIRREMRETIQQLLYAPNTAYCQFLDGAVVRQVLDEHFSGSGNWEHLIAALVVFEISHKLWVQQEPEARKRSRMGWASQGRVYHLDEGGGSALNAHKKN